MSSVTGVGEIKYASLTENLTVSSSENGSMHRTKNGNMHRTTKKVIHRYQHGTTAHSRTGYGFVLATIEA